MLQVIAILRLINRSTLRRWYAVVIIQAFDGYTGVARLSNVRDAKS